MDKRVSLRHDECVMSWDADIVIVGGGDVGAALSVACAGAGLSTIMVDAVALDVRAAEGFDARAYALGAASVAMLSTLGVWPRLAGQSQRMNRIEVFEGAVGERFGPEGAAPLLSFGPDAFDGASFSHMVEDSSLRPALAAALKESGVRTLAPERVVAVEPGVAGATARLASGGSLSAGLVAACDGRRSALARAAGLGWAEGRYDQTGLICVLRHERPHEGVARQVFYPSGPFAMLPLKGDRCSIVWSERSARAREIAALDDGAFLREAAARTGGALGGVALDGKRGAFPLSMTLAHEMIADRLALVGDAAHGVHPLAGQGLNLGLRDAAALAEILVEARRRGEDLGAPAVLARYQEWRRFDNTAMATGMDAVARLFSNDLAPLSGLRRAGLRLVDGSPALKRRFAAMAAGRAGDAPALLRGRRL